MMKKVLIPLLLFMLLVSLSCSSRRGEEITTVVEKEDGTRDTYTTEVPKMETEGEIPEILMSPSDLEDLPEEPIDEPKTTEIRSETAPLSEPPALDISPEQIRKIVDDVSYLKLLGISKRDSSKPGRYESENGDVVLTVGGKNDSLQLSLEYRGIPSDDYMIVYALREIEKGEDGAEITTMEYIISDEAGAEAVYTSQDSMRLRGIVPVYKGIYETLNGENIMGTPEGLVGKGFVAKVSSFLN